VTLLTFGIFHYLGGDPAIQYAGKNASPELIESIRKELGLNNSPLEQYGDYLLQSLTLDWGRSWTTSEPVSRIFMDGLGPTLSLTVPAFFISIFLSIFISLIACYWRGFWVDKVIVGVCTVMMSISFLIYIIFFQKFLAYDLGIFPVYGWSPLPWIIYAAATLGPQILIFRAALLNEVLQDYVRTARAKGLSEKDVYLRHVLRNAIVPIVTLAFTQMPALITGSLVLEAYFGIPGIGGMLIKAIQNSDFPVIKAMTVIGSLIYIFFNLLNDVLCAYLDPRTEPA